MWNEWNRWWSGRGAPDEVLPEETVVPTSKSENEREVSEEESPVESQNDCDAAPGAIPSQLKNADASVSETVQAVGRAHEPDEATDSAEEKVPETAQAPQSRPRDDLGADEPAGFPAANDFESPFAGLDPVAELSRQGLPVPTGNGRGAAVAGWLDRRRSRTRLTTPSNDS